MRSEKLSVLYVSPAKEHLVFKLGLIVCLNIKYTRRLKRSFSKELIWDFFHSKNKNILELEFCFHIFFAVSITVLPSFWDEHLEEDKPLLSGC